MANKRVLELAKELKVEVADIQRAATRCGVSVTSPTAMLDDNDSRRIKAALNEPTKRSASHTRNLTASGPGRVSSGDGRGHTVQVAVRRRRAVKPHASASGQSAGASKPLTLKQAREGSPSDMTEKPMVKKEPAKVAPVQKEPPKKVEKRSSMSEKPVSVT